GSIQGADQTLRTLRGNDFDTASLLIALLRASNIPARYVYGTVKMPIDKVMNWIGGVSNPQAALQLLGQGGIPNTGLTQGGVITAVRLEHVWVEAWVDFYPSRGARNLKGDAWVPLDASFKQYIYKAGMNIQQQVPFDTQAFTQHLTETATINRDEGSIRGMDPAYIQNQLATYQQQVKDFIDNQNPDATVGDVLGAKTIISLSVPTLAAGLPYSLVAVGDRWATLPDNLRWKFTFELEDDYGNPVVSYTAAAPVLAGKDFSLSFKPATDADAQTIASYFPHVPDGGTIGPSQLPPSLPGYLIHLMPEISVDGQSVASQGSFELGSGLRAQEGYWSPRDGWQIKTNELIVGEYQAIGLDLQGIPQERLAALKAQLADTQAKLESGDVSALTGHNLTGAILQAGVLAYFAINNAQDILAARSNSMVQYPEPSFGTFKTTVQTTYNFGIPQSVGILGVTMDIDWYKTSSVSKDASSEKKRTYYLTIGPRLSAFEHIVPEQLFSTADQPVEGISAVKALAIAATQGQKIYRVSQTNLTTALPQLTISQDIKDEIQNAVNAGQEVTVSRGPISYAGWHGTGYIIQDPQTGAGAYKINGGANGSATNKTTGSALNYFGDFLSIIGASQSIASFFAKVGYELRSFKFSDYTTAFKDAGNLL
ncbi:MAG TPA: transglutaminase-like domain-containing protein, partial [Candidatus Saccharimonadales bacterium]|nr:transglutaminase-like domain-containing protein [Candidatus Saccharimonadales bacterium]